LKNRPSPLLHLGSNRDKGFSFVANVGTISLGVSPSVAGFSALAPSDGALSASAIAISSVGISRVFSCGVGSIVGLSCEIIASPSLVNIGSI
jgi:hypothetical protein